MARFFTADLHLGHRNIARYEPGRAQAAGVDPLAGSADDETQAHLDSFLIDRWTDVVGPDDEVWLLGDAVMESSTERSPTWAGYSDVSCSCPATTTGSGQAIADATSGGSPPATSGRCERPCPGC